MRHALIAIRDPRWCASWRAGVALVVLCMAVYLPGFATLPTIDRDEARFAQASRQMFESVALPEAQRSPSLHAGGVVVPMVQDRVRLNKPPLIYWAQALSAAALTGGNPLRDAVWMYRVPSLVAAVLSVLMTWRLGRSMFDARAALLAAVMLGVCPLWVWEARQARADHLLTACTLGAMWGLWEVWRRAGRDPRARGLGAWGWAALVWISIGLGVLTKGPITPMVAGLGAVAISLLTRDWGWWRALKPAVGALAASALVIPWVAMLAERFGLSNYLALVYDETLGRAATGREGHVGPPGYHLVLLLATFWPGSMVTGMAVCRAWRRTIRGVRPWKWRSTVRTRSRAGELFCLAWVLPSWIVFELSATKLPHYIMPLLPALALLSARTLLAASAGSVRAAWGRLAGSVYVLWIGLSVLVGVGATGASLIFFDRTWAGPVWMALPIAGALLALQVWLAWRAIRSLATHRIARAMRAGVSMAVVLWMAALGVVIPRTPSLWATERLVDSLESIDPDGVRPLASLYHEDSLVFRTRGRVRRLDDPAAMREFLATTPGGLGVVRASDLRDLGHVSTVGVIRGFNLARFSRERLAIVQAAPAGGGAP